MTARTIPWTAGVRSRVRPVAAGAAMWAVAVGLALLHETLRANADDGRPVTSGRDLERAVFHSEPGVWVQSTFGLADSAVAHWATLAVYAAWFPVMPLCALFVFVRHRRHFLPFLAWIFATAFIADLSAWAMPVSPPWMEPGVVRLVQQGGQEVAGSDPNPFAAFPSLHAAAPMVAGLYLLLRTPERAAGWAMVAFALATGVAVCVMGEHWVVDVVAGWALVVAVAWAGVRVASR